MSSLRRSLGTLQALALSIAMIGPTMSMAFNVTLAAQAAGRAMPLAFLLGGAACALIACAFVAFARRIENAGSVAAYAAAVFGRRWGFLTGWALLLAYVAFLASTSALVGGFTSIALAHIDPRLSVPWFAISLTAAGLIIILSGREVRSLTDLMLAMEAVAILAILVLAGIVLTHVPWSTAPLRPDPSRGLSGTGYGMAFAITSFAGFEGAATVSEETRRPFRSIPCAILGSVLVTSLFYFAVSYAEVLGFGQDHVAALARSEAPLDELSVRYVSGGYGIVLDLAAACSALGCALASASAAARLLFAMGRAGFDRGLELGRIDARHRAPRRAMQIVGGLNLLGLLTVGLWAGRESYAAATATIGGLAIILVYAAVAVAQAVAALRTGRRSWAAVGLFGAAMLAWPLLASLYPAPQGPGNLWPFVVMLWLAIGVGLGWRRGTSDWDAAPDDAEPRGVF